LSNALKFTPQGGKVTIEAKTFNKSRGCKTRAAGRLSCYGEEKCIENEAMGGDLTEKLKKDDWWIRISVRDTGCGIEKVGT